jgi:aspartate 4-decarboxylase
MSVLPRNTLGVYSFSKYFGCTGWRLGVIAVNQDNIFDEKLAALPAATKKKLNERYGTLTLEPEKLRFVDRLVADSRQVALNHTAGLSLPQQTQMALFALMALTDPEDQYKRVCQGIIARRLHALTKGLKVPMPRDPNSAHYYVELDLLIWMEREYGKEFTDFMVANYEPVDVLFRLAENNSIVLLNGGGFDGPEWSVRISMANLMMPAYEQIGKWLAEAVAEYKVEFDARRTGTAKTSTAKTSTAKTRPGKTSPAKATTTRTSAAKASTAKTGPAKGRTAKPALARAGQPAKSVVPAARRAPAAKPATRAGKK